MDGATGLATERLAAPVPSATQLQTAADILNLFICDGSVSPTQGSANPGLTIQARAARTADYLITERENAVTKTPTTTIPIRYDLSPAEVAVRGVPRLKSRRPTRLGAGALKPGSRG